MAVRTESIELVSKGDAEVVDITEKVRSALKKSGLSEGIGCVFVPGATGAITTIEFEPGCVRDLQTLFDEIAPPMRLYEHEKRWGDGNGHSHLRAALLGPSLTFPFSGGSPSLGTWQQIVFVDFDNRPRSRRLILKLVGE